MSDTESNAPVPVSKIRLRFAKTDDLRFLSHHDLMRLLERLLRRAGLPFRSTAGFHPKPKIVFASALGLGILGRQEVVEIEFQGIVEPTQVLNSFSALTPEGLIFLSATSIPSRHNAQPKRALYHFPLPPDSHPQLAAQLQGLLSQQHLVIERIRHVPQRPAQEEPLGEERLETLTRAEPVKLKTESKTIDLRPFINHLWRDERGLWMDLGITNQGAARPEELLRLLGLEDIMLDGESVLERVQLELEDEIVHSLEIQQDSQSSTVEMSISQDDLNALALSSTPETLTMPV